VQQEECSMRQDVADSIVEQTVEKNDVNGKQSCSSAKHRVERSPLPLEKI